MWVRQKVLRLTHDFNKSEIKADDKFNGGCNLEPAGSAGDKTESSTKKTKDAEDEEIVGLYNGHQAMLNQVSDTGGKEDTTLLEKTSKLPATFKTSENGINNNENLVERPNFDKDTDSLSEVLKVKKRTHPLMTYHLKILEYPRHLLMKSEKILRLRKVGISKIIFAKRKQLCNTFVVKFGNHHGRREIWVIHSRTIRSM